MKRHFRLVITLCLLAMAITVKAIPACPKPQKVQQPDGSYITLMLHGDEWQHFNTTADGYSVVKNDRGYYVYAEKLNGQLKGTQMVAHDAMLRDAAEVSFLAGKEKYLRPEMSAEVAKTKQTVEAREAAKRAAYQQQGNNRRAAQYDYNNFRGLVILVEFSDKSFSRFDYKSIVNDMINQENYTGFGSNVYTGSVRDYFSDNSLGKFQPQFDVCGPYKVSNSVYEGGDNQMGILNNALNLADADINFKDYDRDNDGRVDLVYFILAGNGANYSGNDSRLWWPHRATLRTMNWSYLYKDGTLLWDYASSVEIYGWQSDSSHTLDGIGTICHEFSHVLGLPDFYDTDYANSGGSSNHPGIWSVMASGSYENFGRTPVGYSLYERWSVGFCDAPEVVTKGNNYTLNPLCQEMKGFQITTPHSGEYFLLENRQKSAFKWDTYLPASGMLVHRVEGEGNTAWKNNQVNANPQHNYYEVVRANGKGEKEQYDVFPSQDKTELSNSSSPATLKTWSGQNNELALTNISMSNGIITFTASGYDVSALEIIPSEVTDLGVGVSFPLTCKITPSYAETTLTWVSDNPNIATVSQTGVVKGVAVGNCTITVTSSNNVKATCNVTVKEITPYTIGEFKQEAAGQNLLLKLTDAEVLFAYQKDEKTIAYLRDATGCIMLTNTTLDIQTDDIVNGILYVTTGKTNQIPQAIGSELTSGDGLTITAGEGAKPREVTIDQLTEADYCDLVVVKATPLERVSSGSSKYIWAYGNNNRARIWAGNFGIKANVPTGTLTDLYFDVTAIYATNMLNGQLINELNVVKSVEKVEKPTGITSILQSPVTKGQYYNLNGQRVGSDYKGLVIVGGKKVMKK